MSEHPLRLPVAKPAIGQRQSCSQRTVRPWARSTQICSISDFACSPLLLHVLCKDKPFRYHSCDSRSERESEPGCNLQPILSICKLDSAYLWLFPSVSDRLLMVPASACTQIKTFRRTKTPLQPSTSPEGSSAALVRRRKRQRASAHTAPCTAAAQQQQWWSQPCSCCQQGSAPRMQVVLLALLVPVH